MRLFKTLKKPLRYNIKRYLLALTVFIFFLLLVNISNLTSEQDALAGKITEDIDSAQLSPAEEANLIEHLDELEAWDLIENMEMLQNLELLENMDVKSATIKGS